MKKNQVAIFLIGITIVMFLAHLVVYEAILAIFDVTSTWAYVVFRILLVVSSVSFVIFTAISSKYNNFLNRNLYKANAIWLGFLFYFFLASSVYGLCYGVLSALNVNPVHIERYGLGLFALAALIAIYGLAHAHKIITVPTAIKLKNLPASWVGKKIIFVSDWHLGQIHGQEFAERVVAAINYARPDVVLIGGDLYDGVKVDEEHVIKPLKYLKAPRGVFFITGNHDGFSEGGTIKDITAIEKTGIKVLRDQVVDLDGLQLIGVDYRHTAVREDYELVLKSLQFDKAKPSILLKHVPSDVDLAIAAGVSFQISGHTHRSQVQPLSFLPRLVYKGFDYGLKRVGDFQEYTSSGVGTWGPPFRVGTNAEIVLITLS